jgi:hypothetical protein
MESQEEGNAYRQKREDHSGGESHGEPFPKPHRGPRFGVHDEHSSPDPIPDPRGVGFWLRSHLDERKARGARISAQP